MRSSLVVAGGMITLTGVALYAALDGYAWLFMIAGGVVVITSGLVLEELKDRIEPPPGKHFCPFCSTLVEEGEERCGHCNGLQEWVIQPKRAPA